MGGGGGPGTSGGGEPGAVGYVLWAYSCDRRRPRCSGGGSRWAQKLARRIVVGVNWLAWTVGKAWSTTGRGNVSPPPPQFEVETACRGAGTTAATQQVR